MKRKVSEKYRIAINSDSLFGTSIANFNFVRKTLERKEYLHFELPNELHTNHIGIYYFNNDAVRKESPNTYDETFGFNSKAAYHLSGRNDMLDLIEMGSTGFISRIIAFEDPLAIFNDDSDEKGTDEPIVDHDGNYFEDGEYYVYHECERCHKKIFIKVNSNGGYEYPHRWARHYGSEIEGNLCPFCEEKLSKMKKDLYVRFMEGEKL